MLVEKTHELNSLRQIKGLENYIKFITRKRNLANNDFKKKFLNNTH